jgi:fructoselysine 6-kinase
MVHLIGIGDNSADLYLHLGLMFPGGNAINVAALARRYGHPASYLGWLGDDAGGRHVLAALREEGVDTSRCRVVAGPTASSRISLVDGERVFGGFDPGVTTQIALADEDLDFVRQHDVAHTSIYSYIERDLPRLRAAARQLSFDFSQDPPRAYLAEILPQTTIAFMSCPGQPREDAEALLRWAHAQGPALVVLTRGPGGALAYDGRRVYAQGVVEAEIVDTLGAGDAFIARFLVEHLGGETIAAALAAAAESAATTCGYYGGFGHGAPF